MQYARLERTGNQALADALAQAKKEGLVPSIYCHPVGYHGHAAGPPIGMTDYQQGVPVRGDYVFRPNTWHSIELNVTHNVPEWGNQPVRFALEEDAAIMPGGKWDWIDGRQEVFYLIKSQIEDRDQRLLLISSDDERCFGVCAGNGAQRKPAPVQSYKVVATFPHDTSSFTQGLVFASDGQLYESTGLEGESTLRRVDIATGQTLQKIDVPRSILRKAWRWSATSCCSSRGGTSSDSSTTERPSSRSARSRTSRGLGHRLRRHVEPRDERWQRHAVVSRSENPRGDEDASRAEAGRPVGNLNELEWIEGEIWANIWMTDRIARISPDTGEVNAWIDLSSLYPASQRMPPADVMNGIAYDKATSTGSTSPARSGLVCIRSRSAKARSGGPPAPLLAVATDCQPGPLSQIRASARSFAAWRRPSPASERSPADPDLHSDVCGFRLNKRTSMFAETSSAIRIVPGPQWSRAHLPLVFRRPRDRRKRRRLACVSALRILPRAHRLDPRE